MRAGSVFDLERWAVFRAALALIVQSRRGDVGVPQPFLDLGDVGLVLQGVGCCGGTQGMGRDVLDVDADLAGILFKESVNGCGV